jgi:vacuolar-type H+-ATPase subunit H
MATEKKQLSKQLEEKWVGSRTEVFSRILSKESEIRTKTIEERRKADRMIEDAKGKAGEIKRLAILEEVGKDHYEKEMAEAEQEVAEIRTSVEPEVDRIKEVGAANLDSAVSFIISRILPGDAPAEA